jgi:hypothetical protein
MINLKEYSFTEKQTKNGNLNFLDFYINGFIIDNYHLNLFNNTPLYQKYIEKEPYEKINREIINKFEFKMKNILNSEPGIINNISYDYDLIDCNFINKKNVSKIIFKIEDQIYEENYLFKKPINIDYNGKNYNLIIDYLKNTSNIIDSKNNNLVDLLKISLIESGIENNIEEITYKKTFDKLNVDEYVFYATFQQLNLSEDINFEVIDIVLPEYSYNCNYKSIIETEEIILTKNKKHKNINFDNYFIYTNYNTKDNVINTEKGIDLIINNNDEKESIFLRSNEKKYIFNEENLFLLNFEKGFKENISFKITYPENLSEIIKTTKSLSEKYSLIKNDIYKKIKTKDYSYGLIIGNKFTYPQQLYFNEIIFTDSKILETVLDYCYFNNCAWDIKNDLNYTKKINVGRLPFTSIKKIEEYYFDLPFRNENPIVSEIVFLDYFSIFYENNLGVFSYLDIFPNIKIKEDKLFGSIEKNLKNIDLEHNKIKGYDFYINPDKKETNEILNTSDVILIDTHGAKKLLSTEAYGQNNKFKTLDYQNYNKNRPGIFAITCNSAFYFGESLINQGSKYYFGFLYPVSIFITSNPFYLKEDSIGQHLTNQITYYHSIIYNLKEDIGFIENTYPFILLGDPSIRLNYHENHLHEKKVPVFLLGKDNIYINFKKINLNSWLYYVEKLTLKHNLKEHNKYFSKKESYITLTENDKELILDKSKKVNKLFKNNPLIFLESINSDLNLEFFWLAGKISFINNTNNVYLTINEKIPIIYEFGEKNKKEFESFLENNEVMLQLFINNKFIYQKDTILEKNKNGYFLYFHFNYYELLYFINKGILNSDYQIRFVLKK